MVDFNIDIPPSGTPDHNDPAGAAARPSDIQEISIIDLISEGPIEGLVHGEASVYLEGDQISDIARAGRESLKADETGIPHTISIPSASSENQPVTASMKDRAGNTAYYNDLKETYTRSKTHRWLSVETTTSDIKVEQIASSTSQSGAYTRLGDIRICCINDSNSETDTFFQSQKPSAAHRNPGLYNLKPTCRIILPSGNVIKGSIISLHDTDYSVADNSGKAKRAVVRPWNTMVNAADYESDVFAAGSNEVYGKVIIDRAYRVDIRTLNGNNVIEVKAQSASSTITDKNFTLGEEQTILGGNDNAGNPANAQKYPGSSVEFRTGNVSQEPFYNLGSIGSATFPVTLSASQLEMFDNTNAYPTTVAQATTINLAGGMVQKNIVFSSSFTSAQINEIDKVKIQFEFPQGYYHMNTEGDEGYDGAAFHIELQGSESGGANPTDWVDLTAGAYHYTKFWGLEKTGIAHTVEIPVNTHLNIADMRLQVTRLSPDGQNQTGQITASQLNGAYIMGAPWDDIQAVINSVKISQVIVTIDEKLEHPYSAMAGVSFSSKSFPNPPKRAYHVRGLRVKIPSNYTPRHLSSTGKAVYTGIWNGEFSDEGTSNTSGLDVTTHYTDNPAWVFYDILVNNRYGLGDFLKSTDINKFQLYKVAKYCDELVPTNSGGTEPRFTANLYLTKATAAYKVLKDMATIFRGILYWLDGQLVTVQDSPASPIYNFSQSNIIENSLNIQNTGSKARANQYTVVWNNPLNAYKQESLIVEDKKSIIDTGRIIRQKAVAFGCTSEGQAIRYGRWKAWTSINQTEILQFKTSINASFLTPGDVINVQDQTNTGTAFSGRITASANSSVTLDRNISTESGKAQVDGGNTQSFSWGTGSDYVYKLALLVTDRKVILSQDTPAVVTHGGTAYTYNRGDIVTYAKINGTSTALIGGSDSDEQVEKNISNIQDDDGNDMQVEFRNSTSVETKSFDSDDVSIVNGVTQIAISSPFIGSIPDNTVWAIREEYKGVNTLPSYKEYRILGLKEDKNSNWEIQAIEFYNSKYDIIDKDFTLAVQDPVNPPEPEYVPPPADVFILQTPRHKTHLNEIQVLWENPLNADGSDYDNVSSFAIHMEPRLPDGTSFVEINNTAQRLYRIQGVSDGFYNFGVQTFTKTGRRSEITWRGIELQDPFKIPCPRTTEGVPLGIRSNTMMSEEGDTWSMNVVDWAMQSPGAPGTRVNNLNQGTAATYQQSVTSMATSPYLSKAFIYFDASDTTDYFKLANIGIANFENTRAVYWQDYASFITGSENVWDDCTNNADIRVTIAAKSNKVERSDGTATFTSFFNIGDIIRIKYDTNKYVGGKIAYIEDDNTLYTDRRLNHTTSTITSVDEAKAIARTSLVPDTSNDAVIAQIDRTAGTISVPSISNGGSGYTSAPTVTFAAAPGSGTTATGTATVSGGAVTAITMTNVGAGYTSAPTITFSGGGGSSAAATAVVGSSYKHVPISWVKDETLEGLRALIVDANIVFINYNSDNTLKANPVITLTADALAYDSPEFKVTGTGFTNLSGSAHGDYTTNGVSGQTLTYQLHDGSGGTGSGVIPYDNASDLNFNIAVRESSDESQSRAKDFKIIKVKDGSIGLDGKTVHLVPDDTTIIYDEDGESPSYTNTGGHIVFTATANNFTDAIFKFTKTIGTTTTTLQDWSDASSYTWTNGVPTTYTKTEWPAVFKVEVGEKHSGWSANAAPSDGVVASDVVSLAGIKEGTGGISIHLDNPSHNYATPADGAFTGAITNSGTTMEVIAGGRVLEYVGKVDGNWGIVSGTIANGQWYVNSATVTGSDLTISGPSSESNEILTIGNHTATANTDDQEVITYELKIRVAGTTFTRYAKQVLVKARKGETGPENTTPGPDGKRSVQGYIYFRTNSNANPFSSGGTGTYNFTSAQITGTLSPNVTYSNTPYDVEVASSYYYWTARYYYTDASAGTTSNTVTATITAAVTHTTFSGVVTFDGSTFKKDGVNVTTIDGGNISTGEIYSPAFANTGGTNGGGSKLWLTLPANDTDSVFETRNKAGTAVFKITKAGDITANNFALASGSIANAVTIGGTTADQVATNSSNKTAGQVGGWTIASTTITGTATNEGKVIIDSGNKKIEIQEYVTNQYVTRVKLGKLS